MSINNPIENRQLGESMRIACDWLINVAQIQQETLPETQNPRGIQHKSWRGAFRGEYNAAKKQWDTFCPVWHTGQAIKALVGAYGILKEEKLLESAKLAAEFIGSNRITDNTDSDYGLVLAYEGTPGEINASAVMETLEGLLELSGITGDLRYQQWAIDALYWVARNSYRQGEGLFNDFYYPAEKRWYIPDELSEYPDEYRGRPLIDDAIYLRGYELSGDELFKDIFFESADKLLSYSTTDSWLRYHPCVWKKDLIHPRQPYWWGEPMIDAFQASDEQKYLDRAIESARWYVTAMRSDGGLFRATYKDFKTSSFGHATSGTASAAIFFNRLINECDMAEFIGPLHLALQFCMKMQLTKPDDPNLRGAILEKVNFPDGTDASPYHLRDLGSIFFIQAAADYLQNQS